MLLLLFLALLPFGIKAATLMLGLSGYGLQSLYKLAQIAAPVLWRCPSPFSSSAPSLRILARAIGIAVILAGAAIALVSFLAPLLHLSPAVLRVGFDERFALSGGAALGIVLFLSLCNSALEEWHFRWWLDRTLSRTLGQSGGIACSALAFGCMHGFILLGLSGVPSVVLLPMILGLTIAGFCWSWLLRFPGGIYAAWLSHALTDALLLTWGLFWLGYL